MTVVIQKEEEGGGGEGVRGRKHWGGVIGGFDLLFFFLSLAERFESYDYVNRVLVFVYLIIYFYIFCD